MRLMLTERPSALPYADFGSTASHASGPEAGAARVQVVGDPVRPVAPNAVLRSAALRANEPVNGMPHVAVVGRPAGWTDLTNGNPQQQVRTQLAAYVAVRSGIVGLGIDRGKSAMEGASGVPPRGRPV